MATVTGIWGNSASEVFISILDKTLHDTKCGQIKLMWFDGLALRAL
jgi:hypothetical protein